MITKPRFVTIDSALFANGQFPAWDADTHRFINSTESASINIKGDWTTNTDYIKNDVVYVDGSSYVCLLSHTSDANNKPPSATYWQEFAAKGEAGPTGVPGTPGADGDDGLTAYDLAVDNGYEGTEVEWLASLKGEKGDPGSGGGASGARLEWQLPGTLANAVSFKKRINGARTLKLFKCDALTAPSADTTFDIKKNGTSIFTSAPKPVLENGLTYVETNGFDTGSEACDDNDVFQLEVVSGADAANVNIMLYFE